MNRPMAIIVCGTIMISVLLSGCGNQISDYSADDTERITQYAADILLASKTDNTRLIDTAAETAIREEVAQKAAEVQAKIDAQKAAVEKAKQDAQRQLDATPTIDTTTADETTVTSDGTIKDLQKFLDMENINLTYEGSELKSSYEDTSEEDTDWMPEISATQGYQLLVIHLNVANTTSEDVYADVVSQNIKFRVTLNGSNSSSILMTMLLSDFSLLKEQIDAGASKEYVLITQVPAEITEINSVSLQAENSDESLVVKFQ